MTEGGRSKSKGADELRTQAESQLAHDDGHVPFADLDGVRLVHELQVHQIELVMQNEQLQSAQIEMEKSLQRFTNLFESAPVGYVTLDMNRKILRVNRIASSLLGIGSHPSSKSHIGQFVAEESLAEFDSCLKAGVRNSSATVSATVLFGGASSSFWAVVKARFFEDEEEFLVAIEDISERWAAEVALKARTDELVRSNTELERFAYVASHDLQEPIRMVTGYLNLMQKRYADKLDSDAQEFIAFASDGALRMNTLIQELLDYSRVGSQGAAFTEVNLEQTLSIVLKGLEFAILDSDASITRDALPTVLCDATQIASVFQNLIANTIRFRSDAPPRVHIEAKRGVEEWAFSVSDNGLGIDADNLDAVFEFFRRIQPMTHDSGTGMGLALCRRIVDRHGGKIWAESELGVGSTFFFTLPTQ